MTLTSETLIRYPQSTCDRATRAVRCAPFRLKLYASMITQSVSLSEMVGESGLCQQYTQRPLSELGAESELLWLIQVGLLRREVDGQGLTDSFRLTPLGRHLIQTWQSNGGVSFRANWRDRFYNAWSRYFRLPF
jgi:hypothetical protein